LSHSSPIRLFESRQSAIAWSSSASGTFTISIRSFSSASADSS
jgi:hypothetical protein